MNLSNSTLLLATCALLSAGSAFAQDHYYSYEDTSGGVHFSDDPPDVPTYEVHEIEYESPFRVAATYLPKDELRRLISQMGEQMGVEPSAIEAIVKAESEYNPMAISKKGARGLMQLMPETAKSLGVNDPHDPVQNLQGGIRHFKKLMDRYSGDLALAAAAYNAGEGAVTKYNGVPPYPETVDYVAKVRKYYDQFSERASRSARRDDVTVQPTPAAP